MRYELSGYEWAAIKPMPPNKRRGLIDVRYSPTTTKFRIAVKCCDVPIHMGRRSLRPI
ncbi:hypothetical protein [Bradyrhizobium sp.]|uniref:hypothetical protein n=1 Tax=Bradyrhizobium sp. TaxID=376 RepID=UPI003C74DA24